VRKDGVFIILSPLRVSKCQLGRAFSLPRQSTNWTKPAHHEIEGSFVTTLGFLLSTSIEVAEEVRLHTRITNKLGTFGSAELAQTAWRL
jgi:hypothetical protein